MAAFPETTTETALTVAEGRTRAVRTTCFIRTHQDQFTYFEGSEAAVDTTFGMSLTDLMELITAFHDEIHNEYGSTENQLIKTALDEITRCKDDCRKYKNFHTGASLIYAEDLQNTGHIPISMSRLAAAAIYEKATRAVENDHIVFYFKNTPGAAKQGNEYIGKNLKMMGAVEALYDFFFAQRYAIENPRSPEFVFFNNAIARLEERVIKPNHDSHKQFDRFDLCYKFINELRRLYNQISSSLSNSDLDTGGEFGTLLSELENILYPKKTIEMGTCQCQEQVSAQIYEHLTVFFNSLGFNAEADGEVELTEIQGQQMDALLPILEYLNSANNPFARSGLYGHVMTSDLHEAALAEYRKSESEETYTFVAYKMGSQKSNTRSNMPAFTEDQINVLLYGNAEYNEAQAAARTVGGFFLGMGRTVMGLLTDSSAAGTTTTTDTREEMLALPQPEEYLMLTHTAHNAPAPQE